MSSHFINNFGPDRWLKFPNQFQGPDQSNFLWKRWGYLAIPVGLSSLGMCGGLASTALDLFYSHRLPPARSLPPSSKDDKALFDWLKQRQVDSVTLRDFWKYLMLMFSDARKDRLEIAQAWEQIKQDILIGSPVLIGLERAKVEKWYKPYQVTNIVKNHQVIVWGFEENNGEVVLYLYDPKTPNIRNVTISFNPNLENYISWSPSNIGPIYAFFKTSYKPKPPPIEISPSN
jgi:hypothetical protein